MPADVPDDLAEAVRKAGFPSVDEALAQVHVARTPLDQYLELHNYEVDSDYAQRVLALAGEGKPGLSEETNKLDGTTFVYRDATGRPLAAAVIVEGHGKRKVADLAVDPESGQSKMGMMLLLDRMLRSGVLSLQDSFVTNDGARVQHFTARRQVDRLDAETRKKLEAMLTLPR